MATSFKSPEAMHIADKRSVLTPDALAMVDAIATHRQLCRRRARTGQGCPRP